MRITKARLKEIIKEEVQNFKEARGYGNETEVDDDVVGGANQDFEMGGLANSWAGEIEKGGAVYTISVIPGPCVDDECLWPGDCNNDGFVPAVSELCTV